ncbi:hypothetical protein GPALN_010344 [Globodera pallida]|nr:hypothetical protein GPALN_010344 [Globodera pallida]
MAPSGLTDSGAGNLADGGRRSDARQGCLSGTFGREFGNLLNLLMDVVRGESVVNLAHFCCIYSKRQQCGERCDEEKMIPFQGPERVFLCRVEDGDDIVGGEERRWGGGRNLLHNLNAEVERREGRGVCWPIVLPLVEQRVQ